jgi:hypothetical protein
MTRTNYTQQLHDSSFEEIKTSIRDSTHNKLNNHTTLCRLQQAERSLIAYFNCQLIEAVVLSPRILILQFLQFTFHYCPDTFITSELYLFKVGQVLDSNYALPTVIKFYR